MEKLNFGEELKGLVEALSGLAKRLSTPSGTGAGLSKILDESLERDNEVMDLLFQLEEKLDSPTEAKSLLDALKTHLDSQQQDHQRLFDGLHSL